MSKNAIMPLTDYENVCNTIREKTGSSDLIKSGELTEKINEVFEKGKQAEHSDFWDKYQNNGKRTNYDGVFFGKGWTEDTFKPKYDIVPTSIGHMFRGSNLNCDLVEHLENLGVTLDFSKSNLFYYTFYDANVKRIGVIDGSNITTYQSAFVKCTAEIIDKIIVHPEATFTDTSFQMPNLEEIRFEGVIGKGGLNFSYSPLLSRDSLNNIIGTLKDISQTGENYTLILGNVNLNKLTDEEKAIATNKGWNLQ